MLSYVQCSILYNSQDVKQPKCLLIDEWIKKMWYIYIYIYIYIYTYTHTHTYIYIYIHTHTSGQAIYIYLTGYYSAITKNEILPSATIWTDFESIMLSEIQVRNRQIPYDISHLYEKFKKKKRKSHRYREQTGGCQRQGWVLGKMGEGNQKLQTSSYTVNKSCGCNVQHGNYS